MMIVDILGFYIITNNSFLLSNIWYNDSYNNLNHIYINDKADVIILNSIDTLIKLNYTSLKFIESLKISEIVNATKYTITGLYNYKNLDNNLLECGKYNLNSECHIFDINNFNKIRNLYNPIDIKLSNKKNNVYLKTDKYLFISYSLNYLDNMDEKTVLKLDNNMNVISSIRIDHIWIYNGKIIKIFEIENYIYIFFTEYPIEYKDFEEFRISRISRICKEEFFMSSVKKVFSTFTKSLITCKNYYKILKDIYYFNNTFYGIFESENSLITNTILCEYNIKNIEDIFNSYDYIYLENGCVKTNKISNELLNHYNCKINKNISIDLELEILKNRIIGKILLPSKNITLKKQYENIIVNDEFIYLFVKDGFYRYQINNLLEYNHYIFYKYNSIKFKTVHKNFIYIYADNNLIRFKFNDTFNKKISKAYSNKKQLNNINIDYNNTLFIIIIILSMSTLILIASIIFCWGINKIKYNRINN